VLLADGLRIGLVHDFQLPEAPPLRTVDGLMSHFFDGPVNVIVRGSTHAAEITSVKGTLIVNPGSPTFPNHQSTRLGTIGFLGIENGRVRPSILQLE
jgi:predicted phosphodiesterase